jgi:AcrR family transcriptional regulator
MQNGIGKSARKPAKKTDARRPYHHGDLRRALVDAAFALVTEEQDWSFSLREVSRRAGVSHTAAYNHFAEKRDLLAAVAARGFEILRARMVEAMADPDGAEGALAATAHAYVGFAIGYPALYRLMFGAALAAHFAERPDIVRASGAAAKAVLEGIITDGARAGSFGVALEDSAAFGAAVLSCWSAVHGLSMLIIDGETEAGVPTHDMVERLIANLRDGLKPRLAERRSSPTRVDRR